MESSVPSPTPILEPSKAIGPKDRCDSCNAKAYYLVKFPFGELFFCRHHFVKHEEALLEKAFDIYDDSDFIDE